MATTSHKSSLAYVCVRALVFSATGVRATVDHCRPSALGGRCPGAAGKVKGGVGGEWASLLATATHGRVVFEGMNGRGVQRIWTGNGRRLPPAPCRSNKTGNLAYIQNIGRKGLLAEWCRSGWRAFCFCSLAIDQPY
jgi:hypothetical protein